MPSSRKLAAIMFTDIVGFTAMMRKDEDHTLGILEKYRSILNPLLDKYGGKLHKELGDGSLASFESTLDAVNCAIEIQDILHEEDEFKVRIGIHLGDATFREGDVFGDGVNLASRIQGTAGPGEIHVSDSVYANVQNKLKFQFRNKGDHRLKNVNDPVKIFKIEAGHQPVEKLTGKSLFKDPKWLIAAIVLIAGGYFGAKLLLPGKTSGADVINTSIAIMPFSNTEMIADLEEYSHVIPSNIIYKVNQTGNLKTIALEKVQPIAGLSHAEIASQLGVEYLVLGSFHPVDNELSVHVELIQVSDDHKVWSSDFQEKIEHISQVEAIIAQEIELILRTHLQG